MKTVHLACEKLVWDGGETVQVIPTMSEGVQRNRKLTDVFAGKPIYSYFVIDYIYINYKGQYSIMGSLKEIATEINDLHDAEYPEDDNDYELHNLKQGKRISFWDVFDQKIVAI